MWKEIWKYLVNVFTGGRGWSKEKHELDQNIKDVKVLLSIAQSTGPKYTALKPIDTTAEGYTTALALVADMEEVRWMLYQVRERAVANIVGKPIDGLNVQVGVIMAVAEIERQLHEAKKRYAELVNQKEFAVGGAD